MDFNVDAAVTKSIPPPLKEQKINMKSVPENRTSYYTNNDCYPVLDSL
jgi:hypothetical protein